MFFVKQKTAYEMRISDWSSEVCSSDLQFGLEIPRHTAKQVAVGPDAPHSQYRPAGNCHRKTDRITIACDRRSPLAAAAFLLVFIQVGRPDDCPCHTHRTENLRHLAAIRGQIGRAHVGTTVTNAHLESR